MYRTSPDSQSDADWTGTPGGLQLSPDNFSLNLLHKDSLPLLDQLLHLGSRLLVVLLDAGLPRY
jgi:hypothetical protein